jgi:hypothetical protein
METIAIDFIKKFLAGQIRVWLAGVFGWLILNGYATEDQVAWFITGSVGFGLIIVWSLVSRLWQKKELETALAAPAHTPLEKVKELAAQKE